MLGEVGPSPLDWSNGLWLLMIPEVLLWHVAVEIAVASEMGMRQSPLPCKYCMAEPISSSINFATWCSVTVKLLSLVEAVWLPLVVRAMDPPLALAWMQSPPAYKETANVVYDGVFYEESEKKRARVLLLFLSCCGDWGILGTLDWTCGVVIDVGVVGIFRVFLGFFYYREKLCWSSVSNDAYVFSTCIL